MLWDTDKVAWEAGQRAINAPLGDLRRILSDNNI